MKTTIIYSVNGREIGRDIYNRNIAPHRTIEREIAEMTSIIPDIEVLIKTENGNNI